METATSTLKVYLFALFNLLLLAVASYFLLAGETPMPAVLFVFLGGYAPTVLAEIYGAKDPKFAFLLRLTSLAFALSLLLHGGLRVLLG